MPVVLTAPMIRPSQLRSRRMNAAQAVSGSRRATVAMNDDLGRSPWGARVAMSGPFYLCGKAAARCIVGVDRLDRRIGEQLADPRVRLAGLRKDRIRHHAVLVEAAERQHAALEYRRNLVNEFPAVHLSLGDEDRVARTIRASDIVTDMI